MGNSNKKNEKIHTRTTLWLLYSIIRGRSSTGEEQKKNIRKNNRQSHKRRDTIRRSKNKKDIEWQQQRQQWILFVLHSATTRHTHNIKFGLQGCKNSIKRQNKVPAQRENGGRELRIG